MRIPTQRYRCTKDWKLALKARRPRGREKLLPTSELLVNSPRTIPVLPIEGVKLPEGSRYYISNSLNSIQQLGVNTVSGSEQIVLIIFSPIIVTKAEPAMPTSVRADATPIKRGLRIHEYLFINPINSG
jgi:hypothetical protein